MICTYTMIFFYQFMIYPYENGSFNWLHFLFISLPFSTTAISSEYLLSRDRFIPYKTVRAVIISRTEQILRLYSKDSKIPNNLADDP